MALTGWLVASRLLPRVWPREPVEAFARPFTELGLALLGALGIVGLGQLWSHGIRLPEDGALGPVGSAVNQVLIFAPILLVPVLRRQSRESAWMPHGRLPTRLLVGLVLATLAVTTYALLRVGADAPGAVLVRIWRYERLGDMAQVLLEDVAIAILFVRFSSAIGSGWATGLVAVLFAAGHVPAMLSAGAAPSDLVGLLRDAGLGVAVVLVLQRSRDVAWFWCVHFSLDMTQFASVSGAG